MVVSGALKALQYGFPKVQFTRWPGDARRHRVHDAFGHRAYDARSYPVKSEGAWLVAETDHIN